MLQLCNVVLKKIETFNKKDINNELNKVNTCYHRHFMSNNVDFFLAFCGKSLTLSFYYWEITCSISTKDNLPFKVHY